MRFRRLSPRYEHADTVLTRRSFVDAHVVTLVTVPSAKVAKAQAAETAARVLANRQRLSPTGLARLAADLASAKAANDHPPPKSLVKSFSVPDYTKIALPRVETARSNGVAAGKESFSGPLQRKVNRDVDLPFFVQFDHFESNFVTVSVHLRGPTVELFSLWINCFFAMPVKRLDGTVLPFQEAYRQLTDLAIEIEAVQESEGVRVAIRVPTEDYDAAVEWLADSLFGIQFDEDRSVPHLSSMSTPLTSLTARSAASQRSCTALCKRCRTRRTTPRALPARRSTRSSSPPAASTTRST